MPFKRPNTKDEQWHGPESRKVPMMHRTGGYLYYQGDDFQALDLPYKGGGDFHAGRTTQRKRWPNLAGSKVGCKRSVSPGDKGLRHEETVIVSLPRFKMEAEFKLKPALSALGAVGLQQRSRLQRHQR